MQLIIEYAKSEGLKQTYGQILKENSIMLKNDPEDRGLCDVTLTFDDESAGQTTLR